MRGSRCALHWWGSSPSIQVWGDSYSNNKTRTSAAELRDAGGAQLTQSPDLATAIIPRASVPSSAYPLRLAANFLILLSHNNASVFGFCCRPLDSTRPCSCLPERVGKTSRLSLTPENKPCDGNCGLSGENDVPSNSGVCGVPRRA